MTTAPTRARPSRGFRRRTIAVLLVLGVVAAVSAVVGAGQGPRLSAVTYSATGLVQTAGQRVVLTANQPLDDIRAAEVDVHPAAALTVATSGNAIAVQFAVPLHYETEYRITIDGVRGRGQAVSSTFTTRITTGSTRLTYLHRSAKGAPDTILSEKLAGGGQRTLFSASRIQEFVPVGDLLAVVTVASDDSARLVLTRRSGGVREQIPLPSRGFVSQLHAAPDGQTFGFVFTPFGDSGASTNGLYVVAVNGDHVPLPVRSDGQVAARGNARPESVSSWEYVTGTASALVRSASDALTLVDTTGTNAPVSLGTATGLEGIEPGSTTAVVKRGSGVDRIDLTTAKPTALTLPPASALGAINGRILPVGADDYLVVAGEYDDRGSVDWHLVGVTKGKATRFDSAVPATSALADLCLSPNGQDVAVLLSADDPQISSKSYPNSQLGNDVTTVIVDLASDTTRRSVSGSGLDWCASGP